jgi:hypothetical protein
MNLRNGKIIPSHDQRPAPMRRSYAFIVDRLEDVPFGPRSVPSTPLMPSFDESSREEPSTATTVIMSREESSEDSRERSEPSTPGLPGF